jgi:hypothetical protein
MNVTVPRALNVNTNPAGLLAAAGVVYAAVIMVYNAINHHGVIDTNVIVAAVGAIAALLTRQVVTPVTDPKNGAGVPLVPAGSLTSLAPGQYTQTASGAVIPEPPTSGSSTVVVTAPPAS